MTKVSNLFSTAGHLITKACWKNALLHLLKSSVSKLKEDEPIDSMVGLVGREGGGRERERERAIIRNALICNMS